MSEKIAKHMTMLSRKCPRSISDAVIKYPDTKQMMAYVSAQL